MEMTTSSSNSCWALLITTDVKNCLITYESSRTALVWLELCGS